MEGEKGDDQRGKGPLKREFGLGVMLSVSFKGPELKALKGLLLDFGMVVVGLNND